MRLLRSKRLRSLLWLAADGRCRICGDALPESWHADHVTPYRVSRRTNVHEMQALCPGCNLRKGASMAVSMRKFQADLGRELEEIVLGRRRKTIVMDCTPGAGKSTVPAMVASRLIHAGLADFVGWFVPRVSLAEQAEEGFAEPGPFNPYGYRIRTTTNETNPCKGLSGFVTTHSAIAADTPGVTLAEFRRRRGILVIDECHHVYRGSPVHRELAKLWEVAAFRVLLSGNLQRGDNKPVAFLPYGPSEGGLAAIDDDHPDFHFVRYGRDMALLERAKIPIRFAHVDGAVSWVDSEGREGKAESLRDIDADSPALFAALRTEYADAMLKQAASDYAEHRRWHYPGAKMLVVTHNIREAHRLRDVMKASWPTLRVGIATCKDSDAADITKESRQAIRRFKRGQGDTHALDVLVTVAMAYEGLDCKPITHVACLTHIRSWPWLEQCFDRGTRFDSTPGAPPWERQLCRIWIPDDPAACDAIRRIMDSQRVLARDDDEPIRPRGEAGVGGVGDGSQEPTPCDVVPIAGGVTDTRFSGEAGAPEVDPETSRVLADLCARHNITGCPPDLLSLIRDFTESRGSAPPAPPSFQLCDAPPSVEEDRLRRAIQDRANLIDRRFFNGKHGQTNSTIKKRFGVGRDEMTLEQLRQVWAHLCQTYPLGEAS